MSKPIPTIRQYMTTTPLTVRGDLSLAMAQRMLDDRGIRHLPVVEEERLIGLVSDRDVRLVASIAKVDPEEVKVADMMAHAAYFVGPDAPLDEVARTMADRRLGSAVVVLNGKVVGIFTTVDALRALAELLESWRGP